MFKPINQIDKRFAVWPIEIVSYFRSLKNLMNELFDNYTHSL